ncbi:MAG: helix-turn-helix domain-containing protein [Candidatus Neomarinimicrobiota bacterium]
MVKKASEPKDIIRIDNIKLLKIISDPTRKMIIDVLYEKPLTASEIAEKISYPKDKIYYHIKKLQSNEILIIAESEIVKGITQNKFINAAKKFEIDPTLIGEEKTTSTDDKGSAETDSQEINTAKEDVIEQIEPQQGDRLDTADNPLLASLLKAKGKPQGQIPKVEGPIPQIKESGQKEGPPATDPVRIIADRRRGGDRRTTTERRKGAERRVKQKRKISGGEKRSGQERRKGIEKRVLADRRKAIDRRLEAEKKKIKKPKPAAPVKTFIEKKQSTKILESVRMNLNGLNQAMTFIHTGDNVTFLQAVRKMDSFEIQQTKIYDLPYQYNGHAIKTLPDLIKHVYANYVDPKKTRGQYLAFYSTRYNYEMTFVATPEGSKKEFKDYLFYNLTKSYNLKLDDAIVDWSLNDKYEKNAVVCYSAVGKTIKDDYTNLVSAGIQPRYSTAMPKILHNIYNYGAGSTGSGNALIIYMDERRTNLALIQNSQLVESRYFWVGVRDFYLPLCKMFKVGRKVLDVEREVAEDFLVKYGIEVDDNIPDETDSIPWADAQQLLATPVAKFGKELDNSLQYFSDVRSTISNKTLEIDAVYFGGPGSHVKHINTLTERILGKPVEDVDSLYANLFQSMNVTKQQKKLLKNRDSMLQERDKINSAITKSREDVVQLDKMIRAFKDPEAMAKEIDNQMREKQNATKDVAVAKNALETNLQDLNHLGTEFNNEENKNKSDLEKAEKDLQKQQSKVMPIYTEHDLIEKKLVKLKAPITAKKKKSAVIEKKLRMNVKELSREKKLLQQEMRKIKDSVDLCVARTRDLEKDIEQHIEDQDETTGDLNFNYTQRDEYEMKPRKRQVVFKKQQRQIDQKEFELRKQKKKTIIDMKVDAGTIQDLSKRLAIINERIEVINGELNEAETHFENCSTNLLENFSALDKNELDMRTAVSDFEKERLEHDATLRFTRKKIEKLDRKISKIIESYENAQSKEEELDAENAASELAIKYQNQSFKNEIGKLIPSRDKILAVKNRQEAGINADEKNIRHNNKKLSSQSKRQDHLVGEIDILEADQETTMVTIDTLILSISEREQEVEKLMKIYNFELDTANKVIATANSRLPDFRRKLPSTTPDNWTLADRFNELSRQEQDERKTYSNINGAIDKINEITPKIAALKDYIGDLIALDGEIVSLEKEQLSKETTINNIDSKLNKLRKQLSDLSAELELLSTDIKDREVRHKTETDALKLTQKRMGTNEADLKRAQKRYSNVKDIKEKAIVGRNEKITALEEQLETLKNNYENLRDLQAQHKQALSELVTIQTTINNQKGRISNIEKEAAEDEKGFNRLSDLLNAQMEQLNKSSEQKETDNRELELQLVLQRTKTSELKPEIEEWKKEKKALQQELDLLSTQKIAIAETASQNKKDSKVQLEKDISDVEREETSKKDQAAKSKDNYRRELREKIEKFTAQETELRQRLDDREDKLAVRGKKRNEALKELNKVKKSSKPKLGNFEKEISALDRKLVSLESKMVLKRKALLTQRDEKKSLQEQVSKFEETITSSKKDIVFNKDEIPGLEEEIREQKLKLAGFYDVPTHEANALKEQIKRLESKLQATRASILISKDTIKSSGDKMNAYKKSQAASDTDIRNLENEEKALIRKHRLMKKEIRRAINKKEDLERHIDQLDRYYRQTEREHNESDLSFVRSQETIQSRLAEISARKERSKEQQLDNLKKVDIALEQTLEQLTVKQSAHKKVHKIRMTEISSGLKEELTALSKRLKQIHSNLNRGEKQNEAIIKEIANLEARVSAATNTAKTNREKVRHNNREHQKLEIKASEEKRAFKDRDKSFTTKLEREDQELTGLQEQQETADKDLIVLEARIKDVHKNIPGGKADISRLNGWLNKLRVKNKTERNILNEKDTQFAAKQALYNDALTELTVKREKQEQTISDLEQDITDLVTNMAIRTEEQQNADDQRMSLEDQIRTEKEVLDEILMSLRRHRKKYTNQKQGYKKLNKVTQKLFTVIGARNNKVENSLIMKPKDTTGLNHELQLVEVHVDKRELTRTYNYAHFNKMQKNLQIGHSELVNEKDKMSVMLSTDQDNLKRLAGMLEQEKAFNKQKHSLEKSIAQFKADKQDYAATLDKLVNSIKDYNKRLVKLTIEKQTTQKVLETLEIKIKDEQVQLDLTLESLHVIEDDIEACEKAHHKEQQQLEKQLINGQIRIKNLQQKMIIMDQESDQMSREMELLETQRRIEKKALHDNDELFKMTRDTLRAEKETLKEINGDLDKKLEVAKAKVSDINKRLTPVLSEHSMLTGNLEQARNGERDKQNKINLHEQMIYDNKRRMKDMAIEFENELMEYKEKLNNINENIAGLKEKIKALKEYVKLQRSDITENEKELKALEKQYDSQEIDLEKLNIKIDEGETGIREERELINRVLEKNEQAMLELKNRELEISERLRLEEDKVDALQQIYSAIQLMMAEKEDEYMKEKQRLDEIQLSIKEEVVGKEAIIKQADIMIKEMNKTLIAGPKKIEKFDKKLNTAQDQLDKEREKLKENKHAVGTMNKDLTSVQEFFVQEKGVGKDPMRSNYMANLGLLLEAQASLNILPDDHRADYKFYAPGRFLQSAMLVLLVLFSLFTYSNTNSLDPLQVALPQKKDQLARLNVQREVYNDYLFDLRVLNGFQQLRSADQVMAKNVLGVLKYLSRVVPEEVEITNLSLLSKVSADNILDLLFNEGFVTDEDTDGDLEAQADRLDKFMFSLRMDGFLEVNALQASSVLEKLKSNLAANGNIQAVFLLEPEGATDNKTDFNIIMVL